jgi:hypothetical protein
MQFTTVKLNPLMVLAVLARSCGREEERLQACFSIAAYNAGDTDPTESHTGLNRPGWTNATPHTANAATMWGQCHTLGSQCCHPVGPIPPLRQPTLPLCGPMPHLGQPMLPLCGPMPHLRRPMLPLCGPMPQHHLQPGTNPSPTVNTLTAQQSRDGAGHG